MRQFLLFAFFFVSIQVSDGSFELLLHGLIIGAKAAFTLERRHLHVLLIVLLNNGARTILPLVLVGLLRDLFRSKSI